MMLIKEEIEVCTLHVFPFFWLTHPLALSHSAAEMSQELKLLRCAYFPGQLQLLSDDKLLSDLSSLQNNLRLPTLIPPPVPQGALFRPLPGMSHFYDRHFGPHRPGPPML